jgi:hypothetical protein
LVVAALGGDHASISTIRLQLSDVELMRIRIFVVVSGANVIFFQTLLFPVTLPPGTVTHAPLFQYWTSNPTNP